MEPSGDPTTPVFEGIADVLEGSDEGLMVLDLAGTIRFASQLALRHFDLPAGAAGRPLAEGLVDYRLVRMVLAAAAGGEVIERHWAVHERELSVRALRLDRPTAGVLVWVRDETRVRHLEKMRRDFISNVSHELRTPLAAMRVMAETLMAGALEDETAARDFVHRIGLEVEQMAQMVEELLELSALEGEQRALAIEPVAVEELLGALDRLRPLIDDKRITLALDVAADVPEIAGDAGHLQHVLRNLVHNAVKFTPVDGTISVAAAADGAEVVLRCSDTGVGIRSEDVPRIFERFWKADSSRRRDGEGSGLGLAIARHVVAAHGGSIQVESELGRGTTFTVRLPAWRVESTAAALADAVRR